MRAVMCGALVVVAACGPPNPCSGHQFDRLRRYSLPYAGHWVVARGARRGPKPSLSGGSASRSRRS